MLKMTDTQKSKVSIKPMTGSVPPKPARVDGVPVWDTSVQGIVTLFPAADGLSADVVAVAEGTCQVNVSADADLGTGVKTITGFLDVEVLPGEAVTFDITTGPVEEQ